MTHLLSLEVRHWRGLEHQQLADLAPGLNLVFGPNEAGKSRLFQALQFALWESFKGRAAYKKELEGWSASESPWVAVELEHLGQRYRIEKRFLTKGYAKLEGEGVTLKDEEAEERLGQILGTGGGSGRSALDKEAQGLWRLLWVGQGDSRTSPSEDLNPEPKSRLQDLLSAEVGEVTAGPMGQRVLERVRQEAARYWTPTGQPTGDLRKGKAEEAAAVEGLNRARQRRDAQREEALRLERAQRDLENLIPRIAERRIAREAAQQRAQEAAMARQALETQSLTLKALELQVDTAKGALEGRQAVVAEVETTRALLEEKRGQLGRLKSELEPQEAALRKAEDKAEGAKQARATAEATARRASRRELRQQRGARVEALEQRFARAKGAAQELEGWARKVASNPMTSAAVNRLEGMDRAVREAQARLEGASATVRIEALREIRVLQEGAPMEAPTKSLAPSKTGPKETLELRFSEASRLIIEGIARLEILPGGEGLPALREAAEDRRSALTTALEDLGVESLAAARDRLEEKRKGESEKKAAEGALQDHAPKGLEALNRGLQESRGLLESLGEESREETAEALDVEQAEVHRAAKEKDHEAAQIARDALREVLVGARAKSASLGQEVASLKDRLEQLDRSLQDLPPEEDLAAALETVRGQQGEALLQRDSLGKRFEEAGGKAAQGDLDREVRALHQLEERSRGLQREADAATARISVMGGEGAHEEVQNREAKLEEVAGTFSRLQRRANAARRLLETLEEERRQAQQRLTEPVRLRIEPYLRELFPGSSLAVDEDWQVRGLQTANVEEGFHSLSGGAQEQLSLLVRVGLGEILAGDERLPLILDDALVNTDAERRETLLRILGRAADRLQVIVFTCHDDNYDALGAHKVYRLPPSRVGV